jgi:hypothetical protein
MRGRAWIWVAGGLVAVLAVVLVVVLVVRDDDSESTAPSTTTTSTSTSTTTSTTTTTTTAPPPTTTTRPLPPVTDDPQTYAEFLLVAWENGDRTAAADVASSEAVDQMFAQPYQPPATWTLTDCDPAAGSLYCTWAGPGGQIVMTVRTLTGGLPIQVVMVERT